MKNSNNWDASDETVGTLVGLFVIGAAGMVIVGVICHIIQAYAN